jgi:hypothetical protein
VPARLPPAAGPARPPARSGLPLLWLHTFRFVCLKVPQWEIFDLLDSRDFYTKKPPWVVGTSDLDKIS